MPRKKHNSTGAVGWPQGWVCAAWVIAAAGTTQAVAQSGGPFDAKKASSEQDQVHVSEHMTVDLHVNDEDLINVLQMLSIQSERNIVASNKVSATVSADLYNVTFYEALDAILTVNGYGYIEKGNFIYVYTLDEIQQLKEAQRRPIAKVIRLNYLNANDAAEFVAPLLSEDGQIKTNGDVDTFNIPDDSPTGDEQYALEATMVVVDYPENVEEIEKLIEQLDTKPQQVLVEATILQTKINEANAFGVDFSIIGDLDFTDFLDTGGPLSVVNALQQGGKGSSGQGFSPTDNIGMGIASSPGSTDKPGTLKLGLVHDDVAVFLRLLDEVTDFTVLSNPKVLALNRQPARVLVGAKIGFLNTTSTETSTTQTVEFLDTGTQLAFRPFISKDGFIRMELRPSVSEGVIRQASGNNGASVSIPDEITQEVTTNVIVRDGSTIVLGGLFKESTTVTRKQVPVLGDIPVIGAAFQGRDDSTERDEIIFLITPTIMNDNALLATGEAAQNYVDSVRSGARRQLLPFSRDRMTSALNVEAERLADQGQTEKALWKLRRSLELNPNQPQALRLRERLMGEKDREPSRSIFRAIMDEAMQQEADQSLLPSVDDQAQRPGPSPASHDQRETQQELPSNAQAAKMEEDEEETFTFDWPEADASLQSLTEASSEAPEVAKGTDAPARTAGDGAPAAASSTATEDGSSSEAEADDGVVDPFGADTPQTLQRPAPAPVAPAPAPASAQEDAPAPAARTEPAKTLLDELIERASQQRSAVVPPSPSTLTVHDAPRQADAAAVSDAATAQASPVSAPAPEQPAGETNEAWRDFFQEAAPLPAAKEDAGTDASTSAPAAAPREDVAPAQPRAASSFFQGRRDNADSRSHTSPLAGAASSRFVEQETTAKQEDGSAAPHREQPEELRSEAVDDVSSVKTSLVRTGRAALEPPAYFDPFTHLPNDPFDWDASLSQVEELARRKREAMRFVSPWEVKSLPSQWRGPAWVFDPMFPYVSWSLAPGTPFLLPADPKNWPAAIAAPSFFPTLQGTWKQVQGPLQDPAQRDDIEESRTTLTEVGPQLPEDEEPPQED